MLSKTLSAEYLTAYDTTALFFKVTVLSANSSRLGALITIPTHVEDLQALSNSAPPQLSPYKHVFFQLPAAAANKVYLTWDNNTVPVAGGPGMELQPGVIYKFENAGYALFQPNTIAPYVVNSASAFQLIAATANTVCLVWFSD